MLRSSTAHRITTLADGALLGLALSALIARASVLPQLGISAEEELWRRVFGAMRREGGWCGLWTEGAGSYRPICATYLELQEELAMPWWARHAMSYGLHLVCLLGLGALAYRLAGRRAALTTVAIASVMSTSLEVTSWLGGRCELLWALFALVAAHATLCSARAERAAEWGWALVAATAAALSALSKESGFLLPLLVWPLARRPRLTRPALPALTLTLALVFAARWAVLGHPLGDYVARNAALGVEHFIHQAARAGFLLVWGEAPALTLTLMALAALAFVPLGVAAVRARVHVTPWLVAMVGALAPSLLKSAPRTLYAPAAIAALGLALLHARRARAPLVAFLLLFASAHTLGTFASLRDWVGAYEERARADQLIDQLDARYEPLVIVAPRERFRGRRLSRRASSSRVGFVCSAPPDPFDSRAAAPGPSALAHVVRSVDHGLRVELSPRDFECGRSALPTWIRAEGTGLVVDRAAQPRGSAAVFVTTEGLVVLGAESVRPHAGE